MDSLTHVLIGSTIGQAIAGKKYGGKALFWGAVAGSAPDVDSVFQWLFTPVNSLFFHRGISHSLLFWVILSPLLAWLINKIHKGDKADFRSWLKLTSIAWFSHLFVDMFNTYGTGIFEPFSHQRVAFDSINVVDVFFSFPLLIALILCFMLKSVNRRRVASVSALVLSTAYLCFTIVNKIGTEHSVEHQLAEQSVKFRRLLSSPLPLANLAWMITAEDSTGYWTGTYYNTSKNEINFEYIPKQDELSESFEGLRDFERLQTFTKGWYALQSNEDSAKNINEVTLYDLRFSSLSFTESERFVFRFTMQRDGDGMKVNRTRPIRYINGRNAREYCRKVFRRT
ncbi:MAG: metal-dependent hydrolase [Prevotellaceae bacterium]|jgi:inner membrane protein|nr:metal-dependent hydrolase [Prevotellaceae bacterium]